MISFDEFLKQDEEDKYNMLQECNAIIQQKESIIKEVREYNESILKERWYGGNEKEYAKHNLEILDKDNK